MAYLSNSEADFKKMLTEIGVDKFEDLIENIPENIRFNGSFDLPEGESEYGVSRILETLASKNENYISFLGGGVYDHYSPAIIGAITSRSEYYTAYTPYQPEVSQGNLQLMYEFQSMVSELTGMDITNASMYEGGSALAEAVLLAVTYSKRKKVLISSLVNPNYRDVVNTYVENTDIELVEIPAKDGVTDMEVLSSLIDDSVGCIVMQHPNYLGFFENMEAAAKFRENKKRLLVQVYDPISLGLIKTPGTYGADIAVAEGQSLGIPQNYGGPFVGLFSTTQQLVRLIPGRIAGVTTDVHGNRGFVLTLQTREQHIRREKATSNICTNSGLMALIAGIYLSTLGKSGIKEVAELCLQKSHYLADELTKIDGVELLSSQPFFKEFTVKLPVKAEMIVKKAEEEKVFAGIKAADDRLLIAVTEKRSKEEMDNLVNIFKTVINH
jgi:glycine dehydrogenase subunit 1